MVQWQLPEPEDDADRKLLADVANHGWHLVGVHADREGPGFVYSVGLLHTLGHPEILIMGLSHSTGAQLINLMGDGIGAGQRYEAGQRYYDLAKGLSLAFVRMNQRYYRDYLGYALWFYRTLDFPVLQCVWPDKTGVFPWEKGYDSRFFQKQRVLRGHERRDETGHGQ